MSESTDSIEVHGPGGVWAKLPGSRQDVAYALLLILTAAFVWWSQESRSNEIYKQHQTTEAMIKKVMDNQKAIIEAISTTNQLIVRASEEQTYVMALSQAKREALNLSIPDGLRARTRH